MSGLTVPPCVGKSGVIPLLGVSIFKEFFKKYFVSCTRQFEDYFLTGKLRKPLNYWVINSSEVITVWVLPSVLTATGFCVSFCCWVKESSGCRLTAKGCQKFNHLWPPPTIKQLFGVVRHEKRDLFL